MASTASLLVQAGLQDLFDWRPYVEPPNHSRVLRHRPRQVPVPKPVSLPESIPLLAVSASTPKFELTLANMPVDTYRTPMGRDVRLPDREAEAKWEEARVKALLTWKDKPLTRCMVSLNVRGMKQPTNPWMVVDTTLRLLKKAGIIQQSGPQCVQGCTVTTSWARESRVEVVLYDLAKKR